MWYTVDIVMNDKSEAEGVDMSSIEFKWTDGTNETFHKFYLIAENYYSKIVGGVENRKLDWR